MAKLDDEVKMFIVQSLACYDTPSQVAEAVNLEFGIAIERQQVAVYDPTKKSGERLAQKYRDVFDATRQAFIEDAINIPIASKTYRLRSLQRMHDYYVSRKNFVQAQAVLEQAAKEVGGMFNGKLTAPPTDNPLVSWLQQIGGTSIPIAHDVEAEVIENESSVKTTPWSATRGGN
jgi:hypothetical protein